jgi:hypothetical protein
MSLPSMRVLGGWLLRSPGFRLVGLYTGRACAFQLEDIAVSLPVASSEEVSGRMGSSSARELVASTNLAFTGLAAITGQILRDL